MARPVTPNAAIPRLSLAISATERVVETDRTAFKALPALQHPPTADSSPMHNLAAIWSGSATTAAAAAAAVMGLAAVVVRPAITAKSYIGVWRPNP